MRRTLILGIGAQRAGSTWLSDYLAGHPQVYCSPIKELHYWDSYFLARPRNQWHARFNRQLRAAQARPTVNEKRRLRISALQSRLQMSDDPTAYFRFFEEQAGDRPFIHECTPSYALLTQSQFQQMREFIERASLNLKIVFIMRDPIERHRSFLQLREKKGGDGVSFVSSLHSPMIDRSRYDIILDRLRGVFAADQIVTGFFENVVVKADTSALLQQIGLSYIPPKIDLKTNSGNPPRPLTEQELTAGLNVFRPVYDYIGREYPHAKPASWHDSA